MKYKSKHKVIVVIIIILLVIGLIFILGNIYLDSFLNVIRREPVIDYIDANIAEEIIEQNTKAEVVNIVLFGADNDGNSSDEHRSDAIKVLSLDYTNKEVKISSLERDLVVWIPGEYKRFAHLNWAYWFGEANLAIKTINHNFDLDITKYVTVSFNSLEKIVDLVDGVDIALNKNEMNILKLKGSPGTHTLSGKKALAYSRIRKIDSDYQRMERQQNVIDALVSKIVDMSFIEMLDFIKEALPYITTNLTNDEIKNYATALMSFDLNIKTHQVPSGGYEDTCICPRLGGYLVDSYTDMVVELHEFIYGEGFYHPSQNFKDTEIAIYDKYGYCVK